MKSVLKFVFSFIFVLSLFGCGSTKVARSLNASAGEIKKIGVAEKIAENYGMKVVTDSRKTSESPKLDKKKFNIKDVFVARNDENGEGIAFLRSMVFNGSSYDDVIFSYSSVNGIKTSEIECRQNYGNFVLANTDPLCEFDSSGYYIVDDQYKSWTISLAKIRASLKNALESGGAIRFEDEINPEQKALTGLDR